MAKTPQDHKSELFSFELNGESYTFEKPLTKVKTFGWQRKHRHLPDEDKMYLVFEECGGEDVLRALDDVELDSPEFERVADQLGEHLGGSMGESAAS